MVALAAGGVGFAGEFGAVLWAGLGAGVCAAAKLLTSKELHRNRVRVELNARMRKAPKKILYQEAPRAGEENGSEFSQSKEREKVGVEGAGEELS